MRKLLGGCPKYAGMTAGTTPETRKFTQASTGWDDRNNTTGATRTDFLKYFEFYRWNFMEFNH
ncbi:hypothetical protein G3N58_21355 [Paraburkholderia sp. Ac-20342]|uniref:hypothetical protein n=1 Tax=Paraburkholderia sp. Ac-20342 TaxID=2703889 RepID=UPI00197D3F4B|nr:hypothetical protein [Paraburkholderia sp. Ac-20342]MBN3849351.1 hypothetical protein [Paraburkholderia sp. Ac-20342]